MHIFKMKANLLERIFMIRAGNKWLYLSSGWLQNFEVMHYFTMNTHSHGHTFLPTDNTFMRSYISSHWLHIHGGVHFCTMTTNSQGHTSRAMFLAESAAPYSCSQISWVHIFASRGRGCDDVLIQHEESVELGHDVVHVTNQCPLLHQEWWNDRALVLYGECRGTRKVRSYADHDTPHKTVSAVESRGWGRSRTHAVRRECRIRIRRCASEHGIPTGSGLNSNDCWQQRQGLASLRDVGQSQISASYLFPVRFPCTVWKRNR